MAIKADHVHTFDKKGNMTCCSIEQEIQLNSESGQDDSHERDHDHQPGNVNRAYLLAGISFVLLVIGLVLKHWIKADFFTGWMEIVWYVLAYLPVGIPVLKEAWLALKKGEVFTEFFLMSIATVGAFGIGEYPEGVAVMLFYAIGELFQSAAVKRAKNNIKALLDIRPKIAYVLRDGILNPVHPETVKIGEHIQIKAGEHIPLDSLLISESAQLNMSAITGESLPVHLKSNSHLLAGSINEGPVIEAEVEKKYDESAIARIINLVHGATARKSKTELLIRRLAKIYTPIVVYLALAILFLPYFIVSNYEFSAWLYRALIFLVISCPCALVISIPLGYFGGLGAASKHGILFKGATFLDLITQMRVLVMDKTGTVTKGSFEIVDISFQDSWTEENFMSLVIAVESQSTHPIAKAIQAYTGITHPVDITDVNELPGKGLTALINNQTVLVGNNTLLNEHHIEIPIELKKINQAVVHMALDGRYIGTISIADDLKAEAVSAISVLRHSGIRQIIMLSGDKHSITQSVARDLNLDRAIGDLLPEGKLKQLEDIKNSTDEIVGFVGDGINDAPVLALSDIGFAMGDLGSDVAIETADVIIQTDQVSKIALGIKIGKSTRKIIYQNIALAFGVKILVLVLGSLGMATLWQAVFADVGVALLAILNAVRLQGMKWR
jgi:Cd2+/Zn2+-exporting ATPase